MLSLLYINWHEVLAWRLTWPAVNILFHVWKGVFQSPRSSLGVVSPMICSCMGGKGGAIWWETTSFWQELSVKYLMQFVLWCAHQIDHESCTWRYPYHPISALLSLLLDVSHPTGITARCKAKIAESQDPKLQGKRYADISIFINLVYTL